MSKRDVMLVALGAAALLTACADAGPIAVEAPDVAAARGGNGNGKGGGNGGGDDPAPIIDELVPWDVSQWSAESHALGKGWLDAANVSQGPLGLLLALPVGAYDGAEIKSAQRHRYRDVEMRLRTPVSPGSISAFFFYEGVRRKNDEIDIEIFNDGSRAIWFTTWVGGQQTNHSEMTLPFDPAAGFHDYRIEWSSSRVAFYVDGVLYETFTSGVPRDAMYIMSNAWWPTWLNGPVPTTSTALEIDRIVY